MRGDRLRSFGRLFARYVLKSLWRGLVETGFAASFIPPQYYRPGNERAGDGDGQAAPVPPAVPAPRAAPALRLSGSPPPGHPEQLTPEVPQSAEERRLWAGLKDLGDRPPFR